MKEFFFQRISKYVKGKKKIDSRHAEKNALSVTLEKKQENLDQDFLDLFAPDESVGTLREMAFDEVEVVHAEKTQELPVALQWAEQTSELVSSRVSSLNLNGFASVGLALSSLTEVIGNCGVLCAHSLAAVGNSIGSMTSASSSIGMAGTAGNGLQFDGKGNVSFTGNIGELAKKTGLTSSDIISGKHSVEDIFSLLISSFGKGIEVIGCGLINCLIDGFIPTPQKT